MQLLVSTDTTDLSYWLNWRVLLCAILLIIFMFIAFILLWKYECSSGENSAASDERGKWEDRSLHLWFDEAWRPCVKDVNPVCLMVFRLVSFFLLVASLASNTAVYGATLFHFYTQWTFTLVTIYFGFGSVLSIYGCYQYNNAINKFNDFTWMDEKQGLNIHLTSNEYLDGIKRIDYQNIQFVPRCAGFCGYVFQVFFQVTSGAVMLTDIIFWLFIFPSMVDDFTFFHGGLDAIETDILDGAGPSWNWRRGTNLSSESFVEYEKLTVLSHSINILLLGDAALNCLQIPWFRIAYFIFWTVAYVIFQWIVHACDSINWPYPFLDLSSAFAPLWYLAVALMHIPSYAIVVLFVRVKRIVLSRWFSNRVTFSGEILNSC